MVGYAHLDIEGKIPESLKDQPRWMTCMAFAVAVLLVIACAISMGLVMGYTYCYLEYRTAIRSGNLTEATNVVHIMQVGHPDAEDDDANNTMNGALMSGKLMSRILTLGQAFMQEEIALLPWRNDDGI